MSSPAALVAAACEPLPVTARPAPLTLRFVTFLAPRLQPFYEYLTHALAARLGLAAELTVGTSYSQLLTDVDVAFVCSLPYIELTRRQPALLQPLVAPVVQGPRYGGQPIYYSDVIVRRDSPWRSFADLQGRSWAYNEPRSQSGYGITRHRLIQLGQTRGYFSRVVEAGWHEQAIRLVAAGEVDASAIDSHLLDITLREQPHLREQLRIIDTLGPSPIQPVVVSRWLPESWKAELRTGFLELAATAAARPHFERACVERFVPVTDATYQPIREMLTQAEAAAFLTLC